MPPQRDAEVRLHGVRVGSLRYDRGGSTFRYDGRLSDPHHATLGQIFEDDPRTPRRVRVGLPPWFANLLPEGALRQQIVREMGGGHINDYTLLVRLGNDLPGAVTVHGEDALGEDPTEPAAEPSGHPLRTSLAGVQLKYSIRGDRLTVPVSGDGAWWIAKLPDPSLAELAANEFLTMRWLATAGFEVPTVHVVAAGSVTGLPEGVASADTPIFLIERFDRTHSGRIHVEDFAQLADVEPRLKYAESGATYDSLAAAVLTLTGEAGFDEFVRRLVAMIVAGNTDAHLKNWALIYRDGRTPQLSPVYDFHSLTVYTRFAYAPLALSLNGEKTAALLGPDDFRRLADRSGADPEKTALVVAETVARLRDAWSDELRETASDLFPALDEHYRRRIGSLPICG